MTMVEGNLELLQLLQNADELTPTGVEALKRYASKWNTSPYRAILATNLISEKRLADLLADLMVIERVFSVDESDLSSDAFQKISYRQATHWEILPMGTQESGLFRILIADPTNEQVKSELARATEQDLELAVAERKLIVRAIDELYPVELQLPALRDHINTL